MRNKMSEENRKRRAAEVENARTLPALQQIATRRGYKPSWAQRMFDARQKPQTKKIY